MKFLERVEYDRQRDITTVRGLTPNLEAYEIEIVGGVAFDWYVVLASCKYSRLSFSQPSRNPR